jgi:hypothetical protein
VIDSLEARTHVRPYRRRPYEAGEAIKEIIETGNRMYDPTVLKALMTGVGCFPLFSHVVLSNKQIARVVRQNRNYPMKPVVRVEFDEQGHKLQKPLLIDLSGSKILRIAGAVKDVNPYHAAKMAALKATLRKKRIRFLGQVAPFMLIGLALTFLVYTAIRI